MICVLFAPDGTARRLVSGLIECPDGWTAVEAPFGTPVTRIRRDPDGTVRVLDDPPLSPNDERTDP